MTLLQMSAMGSVLIALTILLRKMLGDRLSPGCFLAFWALAGLRLLLPVSIASPFSVYQVLPIAYGNEPVVQAAILPSVLYEAQTVPQPELTASAFANYAVMLWICGAVVCFAAIAATHWRSRTIYNTSLPVETAFVRNWMQTHKLCRKYQIRACQQVATPLTYGVICPVILLPANQDMSDEELHMVLLHEWNHIRHFDTFWQWVLVAICSIHWFNPLVWMMFVLCRQDMELFCDQAAVRTMSPAQCRAYAYLLLQQAAHGRNTPLFSQFSFTGYQRMEERVKRIMKHKPFSKKALLATVGMLCVGVLCFTTTAMGEVNNTMTIQAEDTQLVWPVVSDDAVITLQSGEQVHPITGETMMIDHICIGGAEKGTDIIASASGVVKEAGYDARNGYYLILQCADDMELHYRHCETLLVTEGTQVQVYDKIATLGQTGDVTGPCLSFTVYQNGEPLYLCSAPAYEAR